MMEATVQQPLQPVHLRLGDALRWLHERTAAREARGVEGLAVP